jgi:membrane-associated phospholipid phosphatase
VRHRIWPRQAAVGLGLLGASWAALSRPATQRLDVRAGDALRLARHPVADRAVSLTTDLGSVYAVCGMGAVLAASGRRRTALEVLGLGCTAWAVAQASKTRVKRQRPYESEGVLRLIRPPTGSSFPSGHAAVGTAVLSHLAESSPTPVGRSVLRGLALYVLASRVYVGVHYPTDVVGGAGLGLVLAGLWRGSEPLAGRFLSRRLPRRDPAGLRP